MEYYTAVKRKHERTKMNLKNNANKMQKSVYSMIPSISNLKTK